MSRRWFTFAALPALVAAGMLLVADQAQAQRFGRGMGFGNTPGYGMSFGSGNPYYGGYGWGNAYSPSYGGYGWNNNAYNSGWGNAYTPGYGSRYYSGMYNTYPSTWDYSWNNPSGTYYGGTT